MGSDTVAASPVLPEGLAVEAIHAHIQKLLSNRRFANSERHCRLLRYLLEESLAGRGPRIKEYLLGVEVFDRGASFDPQTDPIVRTELSRLRAKLNDYYDGDGRGDALRIELPKRSHTLVFRLAAPAGAPVAEEAPAAAEAPKARRFGFGFKRIAAAAALVICATGLWAVVQASYHGRGGETALGGPASVAVLPFVALGGGPELERFSDGLTEELIHCLAELNGLQVVSRTSAFQYKAKKADLRDIAAELNVRLLLEGSVRQSEGRFRVTVRLLDGADGYELYSHIWDRKPEDILSLQEVIARQAAAALRTEQVGRNGVSVRRFTTSVPAYRSYLEGRYHANSGTEMGLLEAIDSYERAIAADPDYAPAHASLADAYVVLSLLNEVPPARAIRRARRAAERAIETGGAFSHAHSAMGSVLSLYDWNWTAAEKEFQKALELDPNDSGIREAYAMRCLVPQRRLEAALFELKLAQRLDPFSPQIAFGVGLVHHFRRDPGQAIQAFQGVRYLDAGFEAVPVALASAYIQNSHADQALRTLEEAPAPAQDEALLAVLGYTHAMLGRPQQARRVLGQLHELARHRYVSGYYFAKIHLALGERGPALDWLEKAAAERSPLIPYIGVNPRFDRLWGEPRFTALLRRAGLSE